MTNGAALTVVLLVLILIAGAFYVATNPSVFGMQSPTSSSTPKAAVQVSI